MSFSGKRAEKQRAAVLARLAKDDLPEGGVVPSALVWSCDPTSGGIDMRRKHCFALALPLVVLLSWAAPLRAQTTEPFTGQGRGLITDEQGSTFFFVLEGQGEPLGHFGGEGAFVVPGDGSLYGKVTFRNADQDMVFADFIGQVLDDGSYAVTLTIVGGAGRFAGASGTADLWGEMFDVSFSINFDGTITY
jgi:hypothetical protein